MIAWVLILTISTSVDNSTTVDQLQYQTEQGCSKAAQYWNKKKPKKLGKNIYNYSAICLPKALELI